MTFGHSYLFWHLRTLVPVQCNMYERHSSRLVFEDCILWMPTLHTLEDIQREKEVLHEMWDLNTATQCTCRGIRPLLFIFYLAPITTEKVNVWKERLKKLPWSKVFLCVLLCCEEGMVVQGWSACFTYRRSKLGPWQHLQVWWERRLSESEVLLSSNVGKTDLTRLMVWRGIRQLHMFICQVWHSVSFVHNRGTLCLKSK